MQQNADRHNWPRDKFYGLGNIRQAVRLVASVCKMIREGTLTADECLPGQSELSRRMRLSVAGVRLGIDVLSALEIVHIRGGLGVLVTSGARPSILGGFEELANQQIWGWDRACTVKQILLGYAAARAARNSSHKQYVKLAESLGELYRTSHNPQEHRLHRLRFQQIMIGRMRNQILARLLRSAASADVEVLWPGDAVPAALLQMAEQYRRIFWAIRDGSPEAACRAMEDYVLMSWAGCAQPVLRDQVEILTVRSQRKTAFLLKSGYGL